MDARRRRTIRLILLFAVVIGLIAIAALTDVRSRFSVENLRAMTAAAGAAGVALFTAAFCVGVLLHVPGVVFVIAGVLAYGRLAGGLIAFGGAVLAVSLTFVVVRAAGGQALGESQRPWMRRIMARLDRTPIRAVALLRLVFWVSPPLNYALALSSIRLRDYVIGSACGLVAPIAVVTLFTEQVARWMAP